MNDDAALAEDVAAAPRRRSCARARGSGSRGGRGGRPAVLASPSPGTRSCDAVLDAGRHADRDLDALADEPVAAARAARLPDHLAGALAFRAGAPHAEEALRLDDLAVALAEPAHLRLRARARRRCPCTCSHVSPRLSADLALDARADLLERELERDLQALARLGARLASAAASEPEPAEDVRERGEDVVQVAEAVHARAVDAGVPELVVARLASPRFRGPRTPRRPP